MPASSSRCASPKRPRKKASVAAQRSAVAAAYVGSNGMGQRMRGRSERGEHGAAAGDRVLQPVEAQQQAIAAGGDGTIATRQRLGKPGIAAAVAVDRVDVDRRIP